jgi:hypothetical protein
MGLFADNQHVPEPPIKSLSEVRRLGKRRLLELVEPAIEALQRAIISGDKDDYISVKAACAILDRTGFGIHSTITIDDKADYTKMTHAELIARLDVVKGHLQNSAGSATPAGNITGGETGNSVH